MRQALYLTGGFVALALGALGIFLPLLPTVPFMILAAFFFARSSPALEARLLDHQHFGAAGVSARPSRPSPSAHCWRYSWRPSRGSWFR
jgi:uncharacterized membrane protein YbaN (DUF454 family)